VVEGTILHHQYDKMFEWNWHQETSKKPPQEVLVFNPGNAKTAFGGLSTIRLGARIAREAAPAVQPSGAPFQHLVT
jgi:hypothetical protein